MARTKQDRFIKVHCKTCKSDHTSGTICTIQPCTKYRYCRKSELATFVASRRLHVAVVEPRKRDYIGILEQADRDPPPFRFLDLPPEMRNWVYLHLLLLNKSTTCHPQILRANRQINSEASSVLYGENAISVRISQDNVRVHNLHCGPYMPDVLKRRSHGCRRDRYTFTSLSWPHFLLRAKHISITVQRPAFDPTLWRTGGARVPTDNTLYSLCLALRDKGVCRRVDFYFLRRFDESVHEKCRPFQILGTRSMQKAIEDGGGSLELQPLSSPISTSNSGMAVRLGMLHKALSLVTKIRYENGASRSLVIQEWLEIGWGVLRSNRDGEMQDSFWMRAFHRARVKLRVLLEVDDVKGKSPEVFQEVQKILEMEMGLLTSRVSGQEIKARLIALS